MDRNIVPVMFILNQKNPFLIKSRAVQLMAWGPHVNWPYKGLFVVPGLPLRHCSPITLVAAAIGIYGLSFPPLASTSCLCPKGKVE